MKKRMKDYEIEEERLKAIKMCDNVYKNILFDLDGVIINQYKGITNSIKYSLLKMNIPIPKDDILKKFIGPPLKESYKNLIGIGDEHLDIAVKYYRECFTLKGIDEYTLYDGIDNLIKTLKENDRNIFLATTKPKVFAEKILKDSGLSDYFTDIIGSDLEGKIVNKKDLIKKVVEDNKLNIDECVMIGDRIHDINGAKENNMSSIGVLYGYGSKKELSSSNYIVEDIKDLFVLLIVHNKKI